MLVDDHIHPNATLSKHAFLSLLTSCIEVYKQETMGILLGERHKKHYLILDALGYQSAKRDYMGVTMRANRLRRINYVVGYITKSKVLGHFHSHPDFPDYLSDLDKKEQMRERLPLQILVLVRRTRKKRRWAFHDNLSISGTVGTKYFVKIRAYQLEKRRKHVCPIKIVCPFLRQVNVLESLEKHR